MEAIQLELFSHYNMHYNMQRAFGCAAAGQQCYLTNGYWGMGTSAASVGQRVSILTM